MFRRQDSLLCRTNFNALTFRKYLLLLQNHLRSSNETVVENPQGREHWMSNTFLCVSRHYRSRRDTFLVLQCYLSTILDCEVVQHPYSSAIQATSRASKVTGFQHGSSRISQGLYLSYCLAIQSISTHRTEGIHTVPERMQRQQSQRSQRIQRLFAMFLAHISGGS